YLYHAQGRNRGHRHCPSPYGPLDDCHCKWCHHYRPDCRSGDPGRSVRLELAFMTHQVDWAALTDTPDPEFIDCDGCPSYFLIPIPRTDPADPSNQRSYGTPLNFRSEADAIAHARSEFENGNYHILTRMQGRIFA